MGCGRLHRFQRLLPLKDWENQLDRIEAVSKKYKKPVLFSEAGCMNITGSSAVPNNWELKGTRNDLEQADWYSAMFSACAKRPWVMGFGVWDWPADPEPPAPMPCPDVQQQKLSIVHIREKF